MRKFILLLLFIIPIKSFSEPIIEIKDPWVRAVPPNMNMTAGYMTIVNTGTTDDYIIGVSSDISGMAEIHETIEENSIVKMRHVMKLKIPAGKTVKLQPGGYHIMFMNLKRKLKTGDKVNITIEFEKSGKKNITADVKISN